MNRHAERRFYAAIPDALALIDAVHTGEQIEMRNVLASTDPLVLCVVLAGLVDQDKTVSELLAWATHAPAVPVLCHPSDDGSPPSCTSNHGTRSRHLAGCRGEACVAAEREYQRTRPRKRVSA